MSTTPETPSESTTADDFSEERLAEAAGRVYQAEYAAVFAALVRLLGDFDEAEDALHQAFLAALEAWKGKIPDRPGAWIMTAARNAALSVRRHRAVVDRKRPEVEASISTCGEEDDDRLRLLFTCCHPALSPESAIALALRTVCGLTTPAIAKVLLLPTVTVAQRLVRAKKKIRESGIPYRIPDPEHIDDRLEVVLRVVYLMFTEGYAPSEGSLVVNSELCEEAIRVARLLVSLMPKAGEPRGLLALMRIHQARRSARTDPHGNLVALDEQDRSRWDHPAIRDATRELDEALCRAGTGPYRIQAAIAALHAQAPSFEATDWPQIASLYEELLVFTSGAAVTLNACLAYGMARGAEEGLARLSELEGRGALAGSDRVAAARADLLRRAGRVEEAIPAYRTAIEAARTERESVFLKRRLASLVPTAPR